MRLAFVLLLLLANQLRAADLVIEMEATGGVVQSPSGGAQAPRTTLLTISVHGDKLRIDTSPTSSPYRTSTLVDLPSGDMTTLDHTQKRYIVNRAEDFPVDKFLPLLEKTYGPRPEGRPLFVATGRKDKIIGYEVEEYVADTPRLRIVNWVAPTLKKYVPAFAGTLAASGGPMGALISMWMPDPATLPGAPLRSTTLLKSAELTVLSQTTIRSIQEKPVDVGLFVVPKDYLLFSPHRR